MRKHREDVSPKQPVGSAITVLLADNDKHVCKLLTHFLGEAGYTVHCVSDVVSARHVILQERPAVVITEVLFPGGDGLALCAQIKSDPATEETGVIVFSTIHAVLRAREAGADVFLSKPLQPHRMVEIVSRLTRSNSSKRSDGAQ